MPFDNDVTDQVAEGRDGPGYRVGQIEDEQAAVPLEYGENPENPQAAGSCDGNQHGQDGIV